MLPEPKKHHFVPQLILRRFAEPRTELLHVFDVVHRKQYRANVRTTAAQERYNNVPSAAVAEFIEYLRAQGDVELPDGMTPATLRLSYEPALERVDGDAAPVIAKVVDTETLRSLSPTERHTLSLFLAVQTVRTPAARADSKHVGEQLRDFVSRHAAADGHDPAEVLKAMGADHARASPAVTALELLESAPTFAPMIAEKAWALVRTTPVNPFVISDNPLTRVSHQPHEVQRVRGVLGLQSKGIELAMPLSPCLCLVMLCPTVVETFRSSVTQLHRLARLKIPTPWPAWMSEGIEAVDEALRTRDAVTVGPECVDNLNERQVYAATRSVMSLSSDFAFVLPLLDTVDATEG